MAGTEEKEMICKLDTIQRPDDLVSLVKRLGFLPFFQDSIAGYSIDEATPARVWDENLGLGPWLWRDDIAKEKQCIYGKFFHKKTGYVSVEWFSHFANYRRDGYDFDARYDDGLARYEDRRIYEIIEKDGPITAPELRRKAGVNPKKASAFEGSMTRLQMMAYVVPVDFIFPRDEHGEKKYSYGTTVFDLPERWLGEEVCTAEYKTKPQQSFEIMVAHLMKMIPGMDRKQIEKMLK